MKTAMSKAINPYSIAVTPDWSAASFLTDLNIVAPAPNPHHGGNFAAYGRRHRPKIDFAAFGLVNANDAREPRTVEVKPLVKRRINAGEAALAWILNKFNRTRTNRVP